MSAVAADADVKIASVMNATQGDQLGQCLGHVRVAFLKHSGELGDDGSTEARSSGLGPPGCSFDANLAGIVGIINEHLRKIWSLSGKRLQTTLHMVECAVDGERDHTGSAFESFWGFELRMGKRKKPTVLPELLPEMLGVRVLGFKRVTKVRR